MLLSTACSVADPPERLTTADAKNVLYREVSGERLLLDVYQPEEEATRPAVLLIYGGGWQQGSKEEAGPLAESISQEGFVVFVPNYREAPPGGSWHAPSPLEDLEAATSWIARNAHRYGTQGETISVLGWSAGGNLGLLLGASLGREEISSVVSWSGPTDLLRLADEVAAQEQGLLLNYIGCSPSTCSERWRSASPLFQVDESSPPALLINSRDEIVPLSQAEVMADRLKMLGVKNEIVRLPGSQHGVQYSDEVTVRSLNFIGTYVR